jgi:putative IMPACT (imprinted ancient) family translation regulator
MPATMSPPSKVAHCSDAGEPAGSAGRPVLAVLQGSNLGDVVLVVTRYFGGTKLGVGGLVRAYGDAARVVVKDVPRASKVRAHTIMLAYAYPFVERMRQLISIHVGQVIDENFGSDVTMTARFPVDNLPGFEQDLAELSSGNTHIEILETADVLLPVDQLTPRIF